MARLFQDEDTPVEARHKEKLNDPRWQSLRFAIFDRDGYTCQACRGEGNGGPLQVYFRAYIDGLEPWEYSKYMLVTLCQSCQELEVDCLDCEERVRLKRAETFYIPPEHREMHQRLLKHFSGASKGQEEDVTDADDIPSHLAIRAAGKVYLNAFIACKEAGAVYQELLDKSRSPRSANPNGGRE